MGCESDRLKIVLLDDDPSALRSLDVLVQSMGFDTQRFSSPTDLLHEDWSDLRGCVVSDVRMLEMSGIELVQKLAGKYPSIRVVLVSAYADLEMAVRAMSLGAVTVLRKPCRDHDLREALQKACRDSEANRERAERLSSIRERLRSLSDRERAVFKLVTEGAANKVIAGDLGWSVRTIENCRRTALHKLGVASPFEFLAECTAISVDIWGDEFSEKSSRPGDAE
jgi:two-component system response regulator FixJ